MRHKTWFRLVVKAIGVYLVAESIPSLCATAVQLIVNALFEETDFGAGFSWTSYTLTYYAIQFALGTYLFFGASWIVNRAIPSNRPYCPECGYDVSNAAAEVCPECGTRWPAHQSPRSVARTSDAVARDNASA